jgi:L-malate glycosyltransferase
MVDGAGRPIRILHVLPWITSGGVEKRRLLLGRYLDPQRFHQQAYCMEFREPLVGRLRDVGMHVERGGRHWQAHDHAATLGLVRHLRRFNPHVIHAGVFEALIQVRLAAFAHSARVVFEEIDYPVGRSAWGHAYAYWLFRGADMCVGVSHAVGDYLKDVLRIPESRRRVIPNGVEPFEPVSVEERRRRRADWGLSDGTVLVAAAGRIHDGHKRISDTIRALARLRDVALIVIGDGPDRLQLQQLARSLGIGARVRFLGFRKDVGELLSVADIFVSASNRESFGQVIVEAMLASLPVVTTAVGGPAEIVVPQVTGMFVPVGSPESIAAALQLLAANPELRLRLGETGRARALKLYTAERYCRDVQELYESLVNR